jgi:REP element-mobilizing transposase RayT
MRGLKGRANLTGSAMPQSLSRLLVHLVFSTKNRAPFLTLDIQAEVHAYLAVVLRENDCPSLQIGGTEDHVHVLFALSRTLTVAQVVEKLKTSSSKWLKTKGPSFADFHWQSGYGVFSVSQSDADAVIQYIRGQAEHHRKMSFQNEYRLFLDRYQVDYDERYMWD